MTLGSSGVRMGGAKLGVLGMLGVRLGSCGCVVAKALELNCRAF